MTTASATQTTPTRSESLPRGFRPVRLTTFQQPPNNTSSDNTSNNVNNNINNNNNTSANNNNQGNHDSVPHPNIDQVLDPGPLSPSTISEISIETSDTAKQSQRVTPPSSPQLKYWTLPRNISIGSKETGGEIVKRIETDQPPPPNAKFEYESPSTKYFTLPVKTSSSSEKPRSASAHSVPAPAKYPGIGPVTENGIPLALRSVCSQDIDRHCVCDKHIPPSSSSVSVVTE